MTGLIAAALAVAAAVVVEIAVPGRPVYHAGWYNVLLIALVAVACVAGRRGLAAPHPRARIASTAIVVGTLTAGLAGVVSGLFAPDAQTFVGAPGERMEVESVGTLVFPFAAETPASPLVRLERPRRAPVNIGERPRDVGNFILRTVSRDVVYVVARDLEGNRLTITQPAGSAFLSPVLLMNHRQTLAGIDLPYDSFDVPATRRVVKAVLFTAAQAAMLARGGAELGEPAVLFAVDDENERPLPHAIALSSGGRAVRAGGLLLSGTVASYPAIEVVAAPNALAVVLGALLMLGGVGALIRA